MQRMFQAFFFTAGQQSKYSLVSWVLKKNFECFHLAKTRCSTVTIENVFSHLKFRSFCSTGQSEICTAKKCTYMYLQLL